MKCQIVDNLHEMSKPVFWEKKKNISICRMLKIVPRGIGVKQFRPCHPRFQCLVSRSLLLTYTDYSC